MLADIPENELTERIIGLAIEVHRTFGGPGLKEGIDRVILDCEGGSGVIGLTRSQF